jgi:hypothetical protein
MRQYEATVMPEVSAYKYGHLAAGALVGPEGSPVAKARIRHRSKPHLSMVGTRLVRRRDSISSPGFADHHGVAGFLWVPERRATWI